jgi:hypothetical protein
MHYTKNLTFTSTCICFSVILLLLSFLPNSYNLSNMFNINVDLRLLVMFLLAEPHFAMTIPLLWGYRKEFSLKPLFFIIIPISIVLIAFIIFKLNIFVFSILFLLFNVFHVNRQSRGFFLLQTRVPRQHADVYELLLHGSVVIFFVIHFTLLDNFILTSILILFLLPITTFLFWKLFNLGNPNIKEIIVFSQGFLVFFPVAILDDLLLAFAIGISIHYIQYLAIAWPVCRKSFKFSAFYLLLFLLFYATISTSALAGFITKDKTSLFIFIPTVLQLLHFYFDGLIWKRSDPVINTTLKKASI